MFVDRAGVQPGVSFSVNSWGSKAIIPKNSINYIALGFFGAIALAGISYAKERSESWPFNIQQYKLCLNECREKSDALTEKWEMRSAENNHAMTCIEDPNECDLFSKDRKQFRFALHQIVDKCFADCKMNS